MGSFLRGGDGKAIAGARVDLDDFPRQFVLLLQNQPGEVGRILQSVMTTRSTMIPKP